DSALGKQTPAVRYPDASPDSALGKQTPAVRYPDASPDSALGKQTPAVRYPGVSPDTALRLTVFGTGYLGITHAACMASLGFEVLGVDTDATKIASLMAGHVPIYEPGLPELLRTQLKAGRLRFSTSYEKAAAFGDVHFICTGTPQLPGGEGADLSQVRACVTALAPLARATSLLVGKSTVPVGTARALSRELAEAGHQVEIAWNPEFLREGTAVTDTLAPDRIVAGVTSQRAEDLLRRVYRPILGDGGSNGRGGTQFFATTL